MTTRKLNVFFIASEAYQQTKLRWMIKISSADQDLQFHRFASSGFKIAKQPCDCDDSFL